MSVSPACTNFVGLVIIIIIIIFIRHNMCLSSRIPLNKVVEFKCSEKKKQSCNTMLSHCANVLIPKRANLQEKNE